MEKPRSTPFYLISSCNHTGEKQFFFFFFGGGGVVGGDVRLQACALSYDFYIKE